MSIRFRRSIVVWLLVIPSWSSAVRGGEPVDLEMVTRIRDEGFHRSKVMDTARELTDVIGPRLTGSPGMKRANEWTRERLEGWGLRNARLEPFPFGRGWSFERSAVHMTAPHRLPLFALPKAWTPGTRKPRTGAVVRVELEDEEDFEQQQGKLAGKILLVDDARDVEPADAPSFERWSEEQLTELVEFDVPDRPGRRARIERYRKRWQFSRKVNEFLEREKVLATIEVSSRDGGIVRVGRGGSYIEGESVGVTALVMAAEHYNRIARLVEHGTEVELEIDIRARFHDDDPNAYNTLAEISGSGSGLVMVGAHLDSWHAGTGATDNAAGCAVAMEAVRILKALDVRPRRTIRIALWAGEEQGLLGSRMHVDTQFASRPEPEDPEQRKLPAFLRETEGPLTLLPGHAELSAYFNLDNGGGRIRGIYGEENAGVRPIFAAWLEPFADLGADTVTLRRTGGTDHQSFDRVALPGFQFIQDRLDYRTRTHHSNLDVFDHLRREDLMQASVVLASFLYHAAMREQPLPRKPLPPEEPEQDEREEDAAE